MRKFAHVFVLVSLLAGLTASIGTGIAGANAGHVFTVDDVTATEGSGNGTGTITVEVHLNEAPEAGEFVQVDVGTSAQAAQGATAKSTAPGDPTPEFPEDFAQTDGTVTFLALETTKTVSIPVLGDNADEPNEMFFVQLFNPRGGCLVPDTCTTGASIDDGRATVTINDDDDAPVFTIDNVNHDEGNSGTTVYDFTVRKAGGSGVPVTVDFATADGSAAAPDDYAARTGTLTFAPSSPSSAETQTVRIEVKGDGTFEPSEQFTVNLSNTLNATMGDGEGVGTITNDDAPPPPSMSASDASGAEGDAVSFKVTLSAPPGPGQTATVDWALEGTNGEGNATEGVDYAAASGSVLFTAGESEQTVSIQTIEDSIYELDDTFNLRLTKPAVPGTGGYGYNVARDLAVGTISNDDARPALSIDDVTVTEGATDSVKAATFTVTKTGLTDVSGMVKVATSEQTAAAGSDYTESSTELTFTPNETTKEFTIDVLGDELDEVDETFAVILSEPTALTIADGQGVGTITDDDEASASFAIGDVWVMEGNSGTTAATLTVTKSGETGKTTTVNYATADSSAKKGLDYNEKSGLLSFGPAETSKSITVEVKVDSLDEANKVLFVNLSDATNASITDDQGLVVILDDDAAPTMSIGDGSVKELANNSCNLTVKLSARSGREIRVHYVTSTGSAGLNDYNSKSGDLVFAPGDVSKVIKIYPKHDTIKEKSETFSVKLSTISPAGTASFARSTGNCSIIDND